jgi:dolichol-phosphate mannosyltransferase
MTENLADSPNSSRVVVIPTFNESENIDRLVRTILDRVPDVAVWVVDDNSPDGTGVVVDSLAAGDSRVRAFHRPRKSGLGTAYAEAFARAVLEGADYVVEMDADFSHDPEVLGDLLDRARGADLVIGTRYIPGGSTPNWTLPRRIISRVGNIVARTVLGVPVHDATSGYRVYNRRALTTLRLDKVKLQGYGFQIETVFQCHRAGLTIVEYPICFIDRRQGQSKMSQAIVLEALIYVFRRRFSEVLGRT